MSEAIQLKGMTWDHPRGYDPLVACSELWRARSGVAIAWDRRSLQDFESFPVRELAASYDLIVIDHPHVGQATAEGCLVPLDVPGREAEGAALSTASVGPSYSSYNWNDRQWALPIDAATQVQAWRGDLIERPASRWPEVLDLARDGLVQCPMRVPHSLMTVYTLAANLGHPCAVDGQLIEMDLGISVYEMLRELTGLIGPACFAMDPIDVLEAIAAPGSRIACAPLIYGYVSYAKREFRPALVRFADIPAAGSGGPVGAVLGGTGIAVSSMSALRSEAIDFAYWIASEATQRGPYVDSGGQPAHSAAWEDNAANEAAADFYRATRRTLDGSWVRPRHNGYMAFQHAAAVRINEALTAGESGSSLVTALNALYRESLSEVTGTSLRRVGERLR